MGTQERICRLCLKICEGFEAVEGDMKDVLDKVLPNIDLASIQEPVVCTNCADMLRKCFDFKVARICRHDQNMPLVNKDHIKLEIKDDHLDQTECGSGVLEDPGLCEFCVGPIRNYDVSLDLVKGDVKLKTILELFFPEMDLSIIKKPVICVLCHGSLESCFRFVTNCLSVEEKINRYCETQDIKSRGQIELRNLLEFALTDVTPNKVDGNLLGAIKVEKEFCEEKENSDELTTSTGHQIFKLEQTFDDHGENAQDDAEHENKDFVGMDDWKDNEEPFIPRNMYRKEDSNILEVVKIEETFCEAGETEIKEENLIEMEDQNCLVNDEIERKIDKVDFDRSEDGVSTMPHTDTQVNKNASKITMYVCEYCTFQTKHKQSLKVHCKQHKNPSEISMYQCDACSYKTRYKDGLKAHLLVHKSSSEVTMFKCEFCSYQTKRKNALKSHALSHKDPSEVTMYECVTCFFQTKDKHYLKKHLLVHKDPSEVTMYKCDTCSYETKYKHAFERHLILHKNSSEITMYKCDLCSFQTKNKYYLKNHSLVHKDPSEITMYKCDICQFETKRSGRLKDHLQLHMDLSELTLYKCESCSFQTKRKDSLRNHALVHKDPSEVEMYNCDSCSFQTKDKYYLKKHLLVHKDPSEVKMYKCETCWYETKRLTAFKRHLILHENSAKVTMHKCDFCSFKSRYKHCLKRHLPVHKE